MRLALLLLLPTALGACSLDIRDRPETRYRGQLTPAAPSARCQPSRAVLSRHADAFTFAPDEGTWVLEGTAAGDRFDARRARPATDHKSYVTELHARQTGPNIDGTYTTPLCDFGVHLTPF